MSAPQPSGKRASAKAGRKIVSGGTTIRLPGKRLSRGNKGAKN